MIEVSIIVPVYKVEKYIDKCVKSILNQTFQDFELILVDDGSPDNCCDICDKYAKDNDRIKVIHRKNGGLSAARNSGIEVAQGKYIGFVDSDDWISKDMYDTLYNLCEENDADISVCAVAKVYSEDEVIKYVGEDEIRIMNNIDALKNFGTSLYEQTVVAWNKLYKKELFQDIRFPEGKLHEDEYTTHKLIFKAKKIVSIQKKMYYYRQREGSIMSTKFTVRNLDLIDALKDRMEMMKTVDDDLYRISLLRYISCLKRSYFLSAKYIKDNNKILSTIKEEFYSLSNQYLKCKQIKISKKIAYLIFGISPKIYFMLSKVE